MSEVPMSTNALPSSSAIRSPYSRPEPNSCVCDRKVGGRTYPLLGQHHLSHHNPFGMRAKVCEKFVFRRGLGLEN